MKFHLKTLSMWPSTLATLITLYLQPTFAAAQNIVQHGSFEFGETGSVGWTGDYGADTLVPWAADGVNFADVTFFLYQDLVTLPGQSYHLRFAMAGNQNWPGLISLQTLWGGAEVATTTWNPAGHNVHTDLGWFYTDRDVVASAPITRLMFQNLGVVNQTPFLDAVSVVAVPEPSCWTIIGLAIGLVGIFRIWGRPD